MRFLRKLFVVLLTVAVLGGAFYFIFERPQASDAKKNPLSDLFFGDKETEDGGLISDSKKFIDEKKLAVKESVSESIDKKENQILDSFKESINKAIDAAQEKVIGVSGSGGNIKVLPVAKTGTSAYFLISNPNPTEEVQYEVDWGDATVENGVLSGENKTISHSWDEEGEFLVSFKILGSDSASESIKVLVTN